MRQKRNDWIGGLIMRSRRRFSKEFKREIVETVVSGQASATELAETTELAGTIKPIVAK